MVFNRWNIYYICPLHHSNSPNFSLSLFNSHNSNNIPFILVKHLINNRCSNNLIHWNNRYRINNSINRNPYHLNIQPNIRYLRHCYLHYPSSNFSSCLVNSRNRLIHIHLVVIKCRHIRQHRMEHRSNSLRNLNCLHICHNCWSCYHIQPNWRHLCLNHSNNNNRCPNLSPNSLHNSHSHNCSCYLRQHPPHIRFIHHIICWNNCWSPNWIHFKLNHHPSHILTNFHSIINLHNNSNNYHNLNRLEQYRWYIYWNYCFIHNCHSNNSSRLSHFNRCNSLVIMCLNNSHSHWNNYLNYTSILTNHCSNSRNILVINCLNHSCRNIHNHHHSSHWCFSLLNSYYSFICYLILGYRMGNRSILHNFIFWNHRRSHHNLMGNHYYYRSHWRLELNRWHYCHNHLLIRWNNCHHPIILHNLGHSQHCKEWSHLFMDNRNYWTNNNCLEHNYRSSLIQHMVFNIINRRNLVVNHFHRLTNLKTCL